MISVQCFFITYFFPTSGYLETSIFPNFRLSRWYLIKVQKWNHVHICTRGPQDPILPTLYCLLSPPIQIYSLTNWITEFAILLNVTWYVLISFKGNFNPKTFLTLIMYAVLRPPPQQTYKIYLLCTMQ